jgi:tetratricopeptide (TPR) repeat protein
MAWWGIAWSVGPNFWSASVPEEDARVALHAVDRARQLRERCTAIEAQLIDAIDTWFAAGQDQTMLNKDYADAMAALWQEHPDVPEIGVLYAQALVSLRPGGLWQWDAHEHPITQRLAQVLEEVLDAAPEHPGANHYYVHAVEASPGFQRGRQAADRLRTLAPGAPHLVHMASHIDIRDGSWDAAIRANEHANKLTKELFEVTGTHDYSPAWTHNHHMLAYACMMSGQYERGLAAARDIASSVFTHGESSRLIDRWRVPILYEVHTRFGRWQELLAEPAPLVDMPFITTMWRFERTVSLAALGEADAAEQEYNAFRAACASIPMDVPLYAARARVVCDLADLVVRGEMAFHRGDIDEAIELLRAAVEHEDAIKYYEPPLWHQPARHALGAVLITAGRFDEAEAVYREDLERWPNNGWSLHGLETCLRTRGAEDEADHVHEQFTVAWANADTEIAASCLCVSGD